MDDGTGSGRVLKRADPLTIQDKFLVGYQGWFTCAGDGDPIDPGHHGWLHWFNTPVTAGGRPNTDLWPDISEYSPSELYPAPGVNFKSGEPATLFSSRHPKTVQRHFHWMARHGVDGVFLQRFLGQCDSERGSQGILRLRDEVGDRVREAAEKEGRVFAIMYDVSGVEPDRVMPIFQRDWIHLIRDKGVLNSPNYLKERGMPVIALWGFGFHNRNHTPELVREITRFIRNVTPGGAYIMAGTPTHWRRSNEDADRNPAFLDVWLSEFDAISPWMVGRLTDEKHVDHFAEHYMKADLELIKNEGKRKIDYIPVIYPGFSGLNLSEGNWGLNQIKRNGGKFMWQQIFNAKRLGLRVMYGAMWDEYDEGTALMPVVEKTRMLPECANHPLLALDADGYDLPADWYMRICGFAAEGLRSERFIHETFPSKELQDYWSTRPHYEDDNAESGDPASGSSSSGGEGGQSYESWLAAQKENRDELPPPPYSLEAEEPVSEPSQPPAQAQNENAEPQPVASSSQNVPIEPADLASLTSELERQSISSASSSSISRPPLHPSHPSAPGRTSSTSSASSTPPPPVHPSRPQPPVPNRQSRPFTPQPQVSSVPQSSDQPSGSQWPPADWNTGSARPSSVPYQAYQSSHHTGERPAGSPEPGSSLNRTESYTPVRPTSSMSSAYGSQGPSGQAYQSHHTGERPAGTPDLNSSLNRTDSYASLRPTPSMSSAYGSQGLSGSPSSAYNASLPGTPGAARPVSPQPPIRPSSMSFPEASITGPSNASSAFTSSSSSAYGPSHSFTSRPNYGPDPSQSAGAASYGSQSYASPPGSPSFPSAPYGPGPSQAQGPGYASHGSYFGSSYSVMSPPHSPGVGSGFPAPYGPPPPPHGPHGPPPPPPHGYPPPHGPPPGPPPPHLGSYPPPSQPYQMPSFPSPGPYPQQSYDASWSPAPPIPPRPANSPHNQPYPGAYFPQASTSSSSSYSSSSFTNYARNAVDKVAGQDTRNRLESGLGSIAQSGSKLLGKFTR